MRVATVIILGPFLLLILTRTLVRIRRVQLRPLHCDWRRKNDALSGAVKLNSSSPAVLRMVVEAAPFIGKARKLVRYVAFCTLMVSLNIPFVGFLVSSGVSTFS